MVHFAAQNTQPATDGPVVADSRSRPILFSGPMVRALLDGRKTQTRRVVKGEPLRWLDESGFVPAFVADPANSLCPYGTRGDTLWVRETLRRDSHLWTYAADGAEVGWPARRDLAWKERDVVVSIHMPRDASRLTLEITDVRIERLLDCSESDAKAEGLQVKDADWMPSYRGADDLPWHTEFPRDAYFDLWDKINGTGAADLNPWVWVVSFKARTAVEGPSPGTQPGLPGEVKQSPANQEQGQSE